MKPRGRDVFRKDAHTHTGPPVVRERRDSRWFHVGRPSWLGTRVADCGTSAQGLLLQNSASLRPCGHLCKKALALRHRVSKGARAQFFWKKNCVCFPKGVGEPWG
jgi:hypothetical protein